MSVHLKYMLTFWSHTQDGPQWHFHTQHWKWLPPTSQVSIYPEEICYPLALFLLAQWADSNLNKQNLACQRLVGRCCFLWLSCFNCWSVQIFQADITSIGNPSSIWRGSGVLANPIFHWSHWQCLDLSFVEVHILMLIFIYVYPISLSSTYLSHWDPLKSTEKPNETQRDINLSPSSNCGMELGGRKKLARKKKDSESKKGQSVAAPPSLAAPFISSQGRELASIEHYIALGSFHMGSHWILILGLWDRFHCPFSTEEKTGNQRE